MRPTPYVVQQRENLEDTIMLLTTANAEQLPVVISNENPVLRGTIRQSDILELYNREILHKEVLGIKMVHRDTQGTDFVDLPEQYRVELVPVTDEMVGRNLRQLDLRGRFGVHVLAIKRPGRRVAGTNELPDPERELTAKDRLIVVGRSEDLDEFRDQPRTD
jgi:Trk K+ transport system NAD-binding subunit